MTVPSVVSRLEASRLSRQTKNLLVEVRLLFTDDLVDDSVSRLLVDRLTTLTVPVN
ncbi:18655_t:CDS:2, partial [Dentiscutata erythropus]